jgi:hypothetical protein
LRRGFKSRREHSPSHPGGASRVGPTLGAESLSTAAWKASRRAPAHERARCPPELPRARSSRPPALKRGTEGVGPRRMHGATVGSTPVSSDRSRIAHRFRALGACRGGAERRRTAGWTGCRSRLAGCSRRNPDQHPWTLRSVGTVVACVDSRRQAGCLGRRPTRALRHPSGSRSFPRIPPGAIGGRAGRPGRRFASLRNPASRTHDHPADTRSHRDFGRGPAGGDNSLPQHPCLVVHVLRGDQRPLGSCLPPVPSGGSGPIGSYDRP